MSIPDGPVEMSPTEQSPPAPSSFVRWWRYGALAIVFVPLCGLVFMEGFVYLRRHQSVENIKAWAQTLPPNGQVDLKALETRLVGAPKRIELKHQGRLRVIYTWPGLLGKYRLRAQVGQDGNVTYLDTEHNEEEDFTTPFLVADADGARIIRSGETPLSHIPVSHRPVESFAELLTESGAAFAKDKSVLIPEIVIFPVMDQQDAILPTGPALSMVAQNSLVFTTRKRMALDPRLVRSTLIETQCWIPGTRLNAARIDLCLKTIGATAYVLPRIEQRGNMWQIHVELRGSADREPIQLQYQATDLNQVPGVIALGLFDHLGETLSPDERSALAAPQFQDAADAEYFSGFKQLDMSSPEKAQEFHDRLLVPNPRWIAAWEYLLESPHKVIPLDPHVRQCTTIAVSVIPSSGTIQERFSAMLKLAPDLRGEVLFHLTLVRLARQLQDKILVGQMLTTWKAEDNSYPSRVARARELIALGQFQEAQDELEQALVLNPQGWAAHTEMIRVANGLNQSWDGVHQHFDKAISLAPDNRLAWEYIRSVVWTGPWKVGPENADAIFHFANQCLDSGLWDQSIPQQVPNLLRGIAYDYNKKDDFSKFQNPKHWQLMEKFYRLAVQAKLSPESLRHAQACFAHDAAITGHFAEAAPVFDLLDIPLTPGADSVRGHFYGMNRYIELRDKVRAAVRK